MLLCSSTANYNALYAGSATGDRTALNRSIIHAFLYRRVGLPGRTPDAIRHFHPCHLSFSNLQQQCNVWTSSILLMYKNKVHVLVIIVLFETLFQNHSGVVVSVRIAQFYWKTFTFKCERKEASQVVLLNHYWYTHCCANSVVNCGD